ncbi:CRISPR system precrRNA processing endoribonuclease RAMP protein Cas6 [Streptomyces sp. NPDC001380]|uniref:CRISPR system precrRNA processing endoribonuclease RAMP protein Cas6 n=1 Tax=Streptomyces sp. NPDC001380 TaxID=3364566 RepID=UPI00369EC02C
MPARWTLRLHTPSPTRPATPAQLHGLACALLEGAGADHAAQHKPFAVSPLLGADPSAGETELCLGWLDDSRAPDLEVLTGHRLRLGSQFLTVRHARVEAAPYEVLLAAPPARHAEMAFLTPAFFSRAGRWIPLPDPELLYRGLLRRWNAHSGTPVHPQTEEELLATVVLTGHDVASASVDLGPGRRTGFTGTASFSLLGHAGHDTADAFAALTRFAAVAGVGGQTTHGQGYVRTALTTARPRMSGPRPVPQRRGAPRREEAVRG